MKRIIISLACLLLLSGCANPFKKQTRAIAQSQKVENQILQYERDLVDKGKTYVYGADHSLSLDTNRNIYSNVAKDMTERSLLALGNPDVKEAQNVKEIVGGLVSSNKLNKFIAEQKLQSIDDQVVRSQNKIDKLEEELGITQDRERKLALEHSALANKWVLLKRIFWIGVWVIGIAVLIHILSFILPPPYNSLFGIVSGFVGFFAKGAFKLAPKAQEFAGVVGKSVFDTSEKTLKQLVEVIQEARDRDPDVKNKLDPMLKDATDKETTRPKIAAVKKELGWD